MKKVFFTGFLITLYTFSFAQKAGWQHLDLQKDGVYGISTSRAYTELLKGKKSNTVIVGIVDAGVDTLHEDLKSVIWTDPKTGHHGWNYIDEETGREDVANLVAHNHNKNFYDSLSYTAVPEAYRAGYQQFRKIAPQLDDKISNMKSLVRELELIEKVTDSILMKMGKNNPISDDFKAYHSKNQDETILAGRIARRLVFYPNWQAYRFAEITDILNKARYHLTHGLNLDDNEQDTAPGNADVSPDKLGPVGDPNLTAYHGTHVAGIIGAVRDNGIGMNGIADNVRIMMLKDNGTIREMRDHCLAQAIRFAVDHGAKVINMSFGKPYTWNKKEVDDAVKYAVQKDVLLVHAAGNNGEGLDHEEHYPNPVFADKSGKANNWLEVGASDTTGKAADFSNYGKRDVDVFAPGVAIYSTFPFNQYKSWDGTSMAAPVVAGLAALIREYYPKLTAVQVRDIIVKSVVKTPDLENKCSSGGIVNAYNALKLASTYK